MALIQWLDSFVVLLALALAQWFSCLTVVAFAFAFDRQSCGPTVSLTITLWFSWLSLMTFGFDSVDEQPCGPAYLSVMVLTAARWFSRLSLMARRSVVLWYWLLISPGDFGLPLDAVTFCEVCDITTSPCTWVNSTVV